MSIVFACEEAYATSGSIVSLIEQRVGQYLPNAAKRGGSTFQLRVAGPKQVIWLVFPAPPKRRTRW